MKHAFINVDVNASFNGCEYRIYINDVMMVERVFRFDPQKTTIEEQMVITGVPEQAYTLKLQNLKGYCALSNLRVNNAHADYTFKI